MTKYYIVGTLMVAAALIGGALLKARPFGIYPRATPSVDHPQLRTLQTYHHCVLECKQKKKVPHGKPDAKQDKAYGLCIKSCGDHY